MPDTSFNPSVKMNNLDKDTLSVITEFITCTDAIQLARAQVVVFNQSQFDLMKKIKTCQVVDWYMSMRDVQPKKNHTI